jgi:electron transport complex protein RnfE
MAEPLATGAPVPLRAELVKGLWRENPVFVQMLGLCPSLAVTNTAVNGVAMGLATVFVLLLSSAMISLLRHAIPRQVRISAYILIIATFVTVADFALQASAPALHRELGAFIALIVVNCIILGRAEAFASRRPLLPSLADALGMGLGFAFALVLIGAAREVLGMGSFFGLSLFGPRFEPWVVMILPPGGFLMTGLLLLLFAWVAKARQRAASRLLAADGGREAA